LSPRQAFLRKFIRNTCLVVHYDLAVGDFCRQGVQLLLYSGITLC
jgi:hypothetical protein